jgi:hypothetical protein
MKDLKKAIKIITAAVSFFLTALSVYEAVQKKNELTQIK